MSSADSTSTNTISSPYRKINAPDNAKLKIDATQSPSHHRRRQILFFSCIFSAVLLIASAAAIGAYAHSRNSASRHGISAKPSQAIVRTCRNTLYPSLCMASLTKFPGAQVADQSQLVQLSVNMTLDRVSVASSGTASLTGIPMSSLSRQAYEDCMELLDDAAELLTQALTSAMSDGGSADVSTWLSAAVTSHDTCLDGLTADGIERVVKEKVNAELQDLDELLSNCLAIYTSATGDGGGEFSGIPIQNRRKLLSEDAAKSGLSVDASGFPAWLSKNDRKLLDTEMKLVQADIIVAADGSGTYKTIGEAINAVPAHSYKRTIIYVKAGRYQEYVKVGRNKWNVMLVGDGKGSTVISGGRSVQGGYTTFRSATFAATGTGFIARDMTFDNWAGADKHQAVALRLGADHGVIFRCSISSYQDTLYVHSQRQFFRECDIYGTVDFIFGNAAVVIQNSNIYARKPMSNQKNTITAQNRKDPNQNTGISIHNCKILAASDLEGVKYSYPTYLGRPWKQYSRVVYMLSYIGDHVNSEGWLPWSGSFALSTLFYGEYMNYGPGAAIGKRVQWHGFRVITSSEEASRFTVSQFIYGLSWLPGTGVAFVAGLN